MLELGGSLRHHPASAALIVANLAVFVVLTVASHLEQALGLPPEAGMLVERPWTPLTVMFTSANALHVLVAVLVLGLVGCGVERRVGPWHLLAVYVLSGLAGSLAVLTTSAATGYTDTSLGASAAFLGVLGMAAFLPPSAALQKLQLPQVLVVVLVVNVAAPLLGMGAWVSSAAHAAGLAVGLLYGFSRRAGSEAERPRGPVHELEVTDGPDHRRGQHQAAEGDRS